MSDNAIRLFGKTIPLALVPLKGHAVPTNDETPCRASASVVDSEIAAATTAASGGEEEDNSNNKPLLSCSDTTSPEKQENKAHTAIFPTEYKVVDRFDDCSLGPDGELSLYLEGLADADDVTSYVKEHPFGQPAITATHSDWNFYSKIITRFQKD